MKKMIRRSIGLLAGSAALLGAANTYIFIKAFGRKEPERAAKNHLRQPKEKIVRSAKYMQAFEKMPQEDIHIQSYDNLRLYGRLLLPGFSDTDTALRQPSDEDAPVIILGIHGYHSTGAAEFSIFAPFYQSRHFVLCIPDDRAHGRSEGNYIGFGYHDHFDCISWCHYLVGRFGENCRIYLHGISMGSATVISCCDDQKLPSQVRGIIADCGYSSGWAQLAHILKVRFHMPAFPMLYVYNFICRILGGYDLKDITPLENVKKSRVPMLFIHGDKDRFVPVTMAYQLYQKCRGKKRLLIISGAGHAMSYLTDPKGYEKAVLDFINSTQ